MLNRQDHSSILIILLVFALLMGSAGAAVPAWCAEREAMPMDECCCSPEPEPVSPAPVSCCDAETSFAAKHHSDAGHAPTLTASDCRCSWEAAAQETPQKRQAVVPSPDTLQQAMKAFTLVSRIHPVAFEALHSAPMRAVPESTPFLLLSKTTTVLLN